MKIYCVSVSTRIAVVFIFIAAGICHAQEITVYDPYIDWSSWAKLKINTSAGLASSYDRTSGNSDYNYYEEPNGFRTNNEIVTAKTIQGPGVIYRFWMPHLAAKSNFLVRMYFDGELTPRIDTKSLTLLSGTYSYFQSPLVNTFAGGQVCYEPIPFKRSVRIETENKEAKRNYYQYTYLQLPEDANVTSYTGTLTSQQQNARNAVVSLFNNPGIHPAGTSQTAININHPNTVIGAFSNSILADITGPGLVRKLCIKMSGANDAELEGLRLRVFYDSNTIPAIDASVANFFGAGRNRILYKSVPLGTDSNDGFYCYWPMPFRRSIRIQLFNTTSTDISIDSTLIQYEPAENLEKMCYLYAAETTSIKQSGQIYHPILSAFGCGHYVGNLLYIEQQSYNFYMLEGDEIITVDGNSVLNGTGTEDAYNGGYYYNWVAVQSDEPEGTYPQAAVRPLNGILYVHRQEGIDYARADQYRWQIADCVPFTKSIDVKIESQYAVTGSKWTSVAFWYKYHCLETDINKDCDVDFYDYAVFASYWLQSNCQEPDWCQGCDFNKSQTIDYSDLGLLADDWL